MENSIRFVKEWIAESERNGFDRYISEKQNEAKEEEKVGIAKNMLSLNMSIENISKATGLSKKQIISLK